MSSVLRRIGAYFVTPPDEPPARAEPLGFAPPPPGGFAPPVPPATAGRPPAAPARAPSSTGSATPRAAEDEPPPDAPAFAAVLGAPGAAVPVAAACAGELRARGRAGAAVLCVWRDGHGPGAEAERPSAGATTPAARRLAERLAAHGLEATACGRLAWVVLAAEAADAAAQVRRCRLLAGGPVVLAIAGPRAAAFEPLLADTDIAAAVLPDDAAAPLRDVALGTLPGRGAALLAPLPPGPPRWAAMAGLARLRSLGRGPR